MSHTHKYRGNAYSKVQARAGSLREVFGITSSVPHYTYVDRSNLDKKFKYFVGSEKHIAIYGASKQGKTILRKKNLSDSECVVVQCRSSSTLEDIYAEILRKIGLGVPKAFTETHSTENLRKGNISAGLPFPWLQSNSLGLESSRSSSSEKTTEFEPVGTDIGDLGFVSEIIKASKKKVVVEDFHYLPEIEKKRLSFDLKALWDNGVFFIVVGVWSESNLLTYYNGDLSGRVNEIDVQWTDEELKKVLVQGEKALNIRFSDKIRSKMVSDANCNVGLLQRVAEKLCFHSGIIGPEQKIRALQNINQLAKCRKDVCDEQSHRYRTFCEAISRGLRVNNGGRKVYERIVRACVEHSKNEELFNGIHRGLVYERVNMVPPKINARSLDHALERINKLQVDSDVSPLVFSYNEDSKVLRLVDLEFIFYKKYGNPQWPWNEVDPVIRTD